MVFTVERKADRSGRREPDTLDNARSRAKTRITFIGKIGKTASRKFAWPGDESKISMVRTDIPQTRMNVLFSWRVFQGETANTDASRVLHVRLSPRAAYRARH
jgi:hypothetical protein